jgi:hypothetical protein
VGPAEAGPPAAAPPAAAAPLGQGALSDHERELLEAQLEKGERVVWADKPDERAAFLRGWIVSVAWLFGAAFVTTIVVILAVQGVFSGVVGVLVLAVLGAVAAGLIGLTVGWPFWARRRARRTFYAFTNHRALGWFCGLLGRVQLMVFEPAALAGVHLQYVTGGPDAVGDLVFGARTVTRRVAGGGSHQYVERYGFFLVRRAPEVEKLLRQTLVDPFLEKVYDS